MDEMLARLWDDLAARIGGPLSFRLVLQPIMAIIFAVRDGLKDARAHRPAYLWTVFTDAADRVALLREGWKAIAKVFAVALAIDAVYQFLVLRWFYPGEAILTAFALAIVPYLLLRGPVNRVARSWRPSRADR